MNNIRFTQQLNLIIMLAMFWALAAVALMERFYGVVTALVLALFSLLISVVLRKITAEQARKMTREDIIELGNIINRSGSLIFVWRMEPGKWPVEFVSENVADILGYTADDFISGRVEWPKITHPDDVPRLEKEIAGYLEKGIRKWSQEYRLIIKSGEVKWFRDDNVTFQDSDGKTIKIQAILQDITERRQAQEALRESEEKFKGLFESTNNLIQMISPDGRILYVNSAWRSTLGYSDKEATSLSIFDIIHSDSKQHCAEMFRRLMSEGKVENITATFVTKDGKQVMVDGNCVCKFVDGKPVSCTGIFWDITARKRAEAELRESEQRYHGVFAGTPDGIIVHDAEGLILDANEAMAQRLEIARKALLGRHIAGFVTPNNAANIGANARIALAGQSHIFETTYVSASGKTIPAEVHERRIQWRDGQAVLSISRDITERKKAQEALRQGENKYRQLVETLQEGIWLIDKDSNTAFVNTHMAEMLDYSVEEMLGKPLFHFMDERGVEIAKRKVERRKQGITEQHDFEFMRKDGSRIYTAVVTTPVTDEKGNYAGALAGVNDITERKRVEEALRESGEKLNSILNNIRDVVWSLSWPDLNILFISPSVEIVFGRPVQAFYDNPSLWQEVTHPDDKHLIEKALVQLRENGTAVRER